MSKLTTFTDGIFDGNEIEKTSAYTVVINTDSGKTFHVNSAVTFTLPAIAIGNTVTFVYTGNDGEAALTISPAAADGISYAGSATDNKDLILTAATANKGDYVTLASLDQTVAWQVTASRGIWAKEAA
jgi:hypothetical protein